MKAETSVSSSAPVVVEVPSNDASETAKAAEESKGVAVVAEPESDFNLHVHVFLLSLFNRFFQ